VPARLLPTGRRPALLLLAPEKLGNVGVALAIPLAAIGIIWIAARRMLQ